jgi:non-heme chloroperoxidase
MLAFHDSGGSGPPLVLLHGWMMDRRVFADVLPSLSSERRTIVPNLRGTEGAVDDYSIDAYVTDVLALADRLSLSTFGLLGHSFGGQLAQNVAARAGERVTKLLLVNPVPTTGLPLPEEMAAHFRGAGGNAAALAGILDGVCVSLPAATRERLLGIAVEQSPKTIAGCFNTWSSGRPDALEIRCATHVLGTDDPVITRELLEAQVVGRIPGAKSAYIPKTGHYPLCESPRETAAWIDEASA